MHGQGDSARDSNADDTHMSTKAFMGFGAVALLYYFFGMGPAAPTSRVSLAEATSSANPSVFFDITLDGAVAG